MNLLVEDRRYQPDAQGEVPLPAGCRRLRGSTRLAHAGSTVVARPPGRLVTAGGDSVRVFDDTTGALLRRIRTRGSILLAASARQGAALALVLLHHTQGRLPELGRYRRSHLQPAWLDLAAGTLAPLGEEYPGELRHLVVTPAGDRVALAPPDGRIEVRRVPDGAVLGRVGLPHPLDSLAFTDDGEFLEALASGNPNPTAELNDRTPWETVRGRWRSRDLAPEPSPRVEDPFPEPGTESLAALRATRELPRLHGPWSAPPREPLAAAVRGLLEVAGAGPPRPGVAATIPGGPLLAVACEGAPGEADEVVLLDPAGPSLVSRSALGGGVALWSLLGTPDGRWILAGAEDGRLHALGLREPRPVALLEGDPGAVVSLEVSPGGDVLEADHVDGSRLAWDLEALRARWLV